MRSNVLSRSTVIAVALSASTLVFFVGAFFVGARAGTALEGSARSVSVARVPMPLLASTGSSPVHTHVR